METRWKAVDIRTTVDYCGTAGSSLSCCIDAGEYANQNVVAVKLLSCVFSNMMIT